MVRIHCAICLEHSSRMEKFSNLPCGHVFCRDCIVEYIEYAEGRDSDACCPQCRLEPITEEDLRPIFLQFADGSASSSQSGATARATQKDRKEKLDKRLRLVKKDLAKLDLDASLSRVKAVADSIDAFEDVDDGLGQLASLFSGWFRAKGTKVYSKFRELDSELDELKAENEELKDENDALKTEHADALLNNAAKLKKSQNTIDALQDTVRRLERRLAEVERREADARSQAKEMAKLKHKCEELSEQTIKAQKRRDVLNDLLGENSEKLNRAHTKCNKYKAWVHELEAKVKSFEARPDVIVDDTPDENPEESLVIRSKNPDHEDFEARIPARKRRRLNSTHSSNEIVPSAKKTLSSRSGFNKPSISSFPPLSPLRSRSSSPLLERDSSDWDEMDSLFDAPLSVPSRIRPKVSRAPSSPRAESSSSKPHRSPRQPTSDRYSKYNVALPSGSRKRSGRE